MAIRRRHHIEIDETGHCHEVEGSSYQEHNEIRNIMEEDDDDNNGNVIFLTSGNDVYVNRSDSNLTINATQGGNDSITSGAGNDTIYSGDGNDTVTGGAGADNLNGGTGIDTLNYSASDVGVSVNLLLGLGANGDAQGDVFSNFENIIGSSLNDTLIGNSASNILTGGAGADNLNGGAGIDTASYFNSATGVTVNLASGLGTGGDAAGETLANIEIVEGSNNGNDKLTGSANNDVLLGMGGNDTISGGVGADTLDGGLGIDVLSYMSNTSAVSVNLMLGVASDGDSFLNFENIVGSNYADTLIGDEGQNTLSAGLGNDTLTGGAGNDYLNGGDGTDAVIYTGNRADYTIELVNGVYVVTDTRPNAPDGVDRVSGVELFIFNDGSIPSTNIATTYLTTGNDTYYGTEFTDIVNATQGGNDYISLGAGNDWVLAGAGNNTLIGGLGADTLNGGAGIDLLDYSASTLAVTVDLNLGSGLGGDAQGDRIVNIENLLGSANNDSLTGSSANNTIEGGAGADKLEGGVGLDFVSYAHSSQGVTVNLFAREFNGGDATGDNVSGFEGIIGSSYNDSLVGDAGSTEIIGGTGSDSMWGLDGNDILRDNEGNDFIYAGSGNDIVYNGTGSDFTRLEGGNDTYYSNLGNDHIYGGAGADNFHFETGYFYSVIADVNMKGGIEGDHLTFSQAQFANFDALMARTFQEGTDTVIRMPNAVIKLTGVSISDITIDDFSFLYAV